MENAENFIRKYSGGQILEKVLREIKWSEGLKFYSEVLKFGKELPLKRTRPTSQCEVCHGESGPQLYCMVCNENSIHKKKCAGIRSNTWTCKKCSTPNSLPLIDIPKKKPKETVPSLELPMLTRNGSSITEISVSQNINKILSESLKDKILYNIIAQRQKEYLDIHTEVQKMNESLALIQKPEEMRRKRYQIDEFLRTNTENLTCDLIDQLHCAHIPGFESAKKLQKLFENDINTLEKYRNSQKEIVCGLLKSHLPSLNVKETEPPQVSKFDKFMDKNNAKGIYAKLTKTISSFNELSIKETAAPTPAILYGIVKVIIDGTLANCEYTPGQQIDHVGGGTNPEMLRGVLKKIKEKYKI